MLRPGRNIVQLTGLRGVAALAVVFHHAANQMGGDWYFRGQPMVDIFFVLSGFVMGYVYLSRDKLDWKAFALARFARVYPLHIATALAMAAASVAVARMGHKPWPDYVNPIQALREATLTMAMPVVGVDKLWNFPAWSISVEWWVYFTLFPLLALFGPRLSQGRALALFLVAAIGMAVLLHLGVGKSTRGWMAFGRALVGFGGGWLAYRFATQTDLTIPDRAVDALALAVVVCIYGTAPLIDDDAWYLLPIYPLLVFGLATGSRALSIRALASRPFEWLGDISFSIYLVHSIVLNVIEALAPRVMPITSRAEWIVLLVTGTLLVAPCSYYWFEVPMRRLLTHRRKAPVAVTDSGAPWPAQPATGGSPRPDPKA